MSGKQQSKNKTMDWLKGVLSHRDESEQDERQPDDLEPIRLAAEAVETIASEPVAVTDGQHDHPKSKMLFSRDNQDKAALDLIVAVENLLNDRQLVTFKNKGLQEQLHSAGETISRLKSELNKKELIILDKDKELRKLEEKLTSKQMSYDQLLEDYKEYQHTSNIGIEGLKNQLEKELARYAKLDEEYTKYKYDMMQKTKELEGRIRDLEVENQKTSENYQKIVEEKAQLVQTITDFTERMSFSFSQTKN